MSYKECLIFIAYVKYIRTSSVPHSAEDEQVATSGVPSDATDVTIKPHRTPPSPRRRKPKFTLEELLAQMPEDGGQGEVDTGPSVGNEVW